MKYSIYNKKTGRVTKTVSVPESMLELQFNPETEGVIEGGFDDLQFYIEGGTAIKMPDQPNAYCIFDYEKKIWIDPRTSETEWVLVRAERDKRLLACDWTQLPDVPLATKEAWAVYRQALRDITNQPDPFNIIWPEPPQ